jgi:hypothetical protein
MTFAKKLKSGFPESATRSSRLPFDRVPSPNFPGVRFGTPFYFLASLGLLVLTVIGFRLFRLEGKA